MFCYSETKVLMLTYFCYFYFRKLMFGVVKIIFQVLWNSVCGGDGGGGRGHFLDAVRRGIQLGGRGIKGEMKPAGHMI